ncbi:hypothetical protein [Agromyces salentinus]|uniref:Secreted protein n=1 Tax=Agromyces salentinus TaxID=269421 RepID=A0ABN2MUP3_9MICO|nr:hypothetical protein [Agromyces salentinus]
MQKIMKTTALLFAGALLFTGCASSNGSDTASGDDNCEVVRVAVRDISNGAQNAIATSVDQPTLTEKLEGYSQRLDEVADENADDEDLVTAIDGLQEKITAAEEYAATLPTAAPGEGEESTIDPDAQATASGDIQAAAVTVTEVCEAE